LKGLSVSNERVELIGQPEAAGAGVGVERYERMRTVAVVLAATLLTAVCAHLSIPLFFTPVPLSLAPFAVLLIGLLLSPRLAAISLSAYLAEGAAGLPVFAPAGPAGIAHLMGPTGGYLLAYPLAAALIALIVRRTAKGFASLLLAAGLGSVLILACGAAWLSVLTHSPLTGVIRLAVLPFLPGDALKVAAAAALASGWIRLRRSA